VEKNKNNNQTHALPHWKKKKKKINLIEEE